MIKVGITGQAGFIGTHLFNTLGLFTDRYIRIPFADNYFDIEETLDAFVSQCDVIVHLAAMNRNNDVDVLYHTNIGLVNKLIGSMERTGSRPYVIMSSSLQEERDNLYGKSKKEGRELFNKWADKNNSLFTGLIIPNVFGPFGVPFYNSVISTFSYQVVNDLEPKIEVDAELKLIYVGDLVSEILNLISDYDDRHNYDKHQSLTSTSCFQRVKHIEHQALYKVSDLLKKINSYKEIYMKSGVFPDLRDYFDLCLFNTFRSYIPLNYFPVVYLKHSDSRGDFVEVMKYQSGGQTSYSTTKPGVTRGNHFHLRKVERFAVIQGKASLKLRKFGSNEVIEYIIDESNPAYVDMPIWYAHNITNIGNNDLITLFWISELFDPESPDTYFDTV